MPPAPDLNLPGFLPPHEPIPPPSPATLVPTAASTLSALQASFTANQSDISPASPASSSAFGYPIQHPPPTQSSPNVILAFIFLGGISGIALFFTIHLIYRSHTSKSRRRDTLSLYFKQETQRRRTVESWRISLTRPEQERIYDAQQAQSQSQLQDRFEAMRQEDQEAMEQETIRQDRQEALRSLEGLGSPPAVFSEHGFRNFVSEIDRAREDRRREALQKAQQQPPPPYSPFPENEHSFIQAPLFPNLAAPQQVYLRGGAGEGTSLQDRRSEFWSSEAYVEEVEAQRAAEPSVPSTPSSKFGLVLTWLRDHIPAFLKRPTAIPTQNGAAKNVQVGAALSQDHGREEGNATAKKGSVSVTKIKLWIEERIDKSKKIEHEREAILRRL